MFCEDTQCDQSQGSKDELHCCDDRGSCDDLQCPDNMVQKEGPGLCPGVECSVANCCNPRANCNTHFCPEADASMVNRLPEEDEVLLCADAICEHATDANECCEPRAQCNEDICSDSQYFSGAAELCVGTECDADVDQNICCSPRDFCHNALFECVGNDGLVDSPATVMCTENPCTEGNDYDICCETKGICSTMLPGSAVRFCNSFDSYACEFGIKANPHEVPCPNDNCNEAACCREATGEPLPETRPVGLAEDRDVVQYKTRITGLMHGRMGNKFSALDGEIKPVFASAAGVSPAQVATSYDPGSVLVTATITANPNQELTVTTLPAADDVLSAVKKIEHVLKEARIPGTELEAAAPVGVKFAANSETAEQVTPPTPSPPPTPPPTPRTPDEETDDDTDQTDAEAPAKETNTSRSSDANKYFSVQSFASLLCLMIWHFLP